MNIGEETRERERESFGYTYTAMRFNVVRILVSARQVMNWDHLIIVVLRWAELSQEFWRRVSDQTTRTTPPTSSRPGKYSVRSSWQVYG
jgi:hypothetical protein